MGKVLMRLFRVVSAGALAFVPLLSAGNASAAAQARLYVADAVTSSDGPGYGTNTSCSHAYLTINYAIGEASTGDTVIVCGGTYSEQVTVDKSVTLQGLNHPLIDPGISGIGITVIADGVTVRGFSVRDAFASIDVRGAMHVRVVGNTVRTSLIGINVEDSAYSSITRNVVDGNDCVGISVFSLGPAITDHIDVTGNLVENNVNATCLAPSPDFSVTPQGLPGGIVIAEATGGRTFGNIVSRNIVLDNGQVPALPGAGVVIEAPFGITFTPRSGTVGARTRRSDAVLRPRTSVPVAGGGVLRNVIISNLIAGNGLPGVTVINADMRPTVNMSGNVITLNKIGRNNLQGLALLPDALGTTAALFGPALTVVDRRTTGIIAASTRPLFVQMPANTIIGDDYGVWLDPKVSAPTALLNQFIAVPVPVFFSPR